MKLADYIKDEVDEQLDEVYEEGVKKGIEQGIDTGIINGVETLKKRGFDDQTIFDIITEQFNVSAEKVKEVISKNKAVC